MKCTYLNFLKKDIDLAPLGIAKRPDQPPYFCTPKGARIIGWAGVDGIHFCLIHGFGEMVFAVSPMNIAPHYVHPLACNFEDFLRLLLACGDSAALEQAWQWNTEQFAAFLADYPPTEEQKAVLTQLAKQTGLSPMQNPWHYLHQLQTTFDYRKIKYTQAFYDLDLNPDAPRKPQAWKVTFCGDFWGHCGQGQAGKELAVQKPFEWAGRHWLIPAVYLCGKGLVVDFCMRVEPSDIQAFTKKWDLTAENEQEQQFSKVQQMQMELDNPMYFDFCSLLHVNGRKLEITQGLGTTYNPCLKPEYVIEDEARWVVAHYHLDPRFGWVILRASYSWATKRKPNIHSLSVTMTQNPVSIPGPRFQVKGPGDTISFSHGGQQHCLTVQEYEAQTVDWSHMPDTGIQRPNHYVAMSYIVTPVLPDGVLTIDDCDDGDRPIQTPSAPGLPEATAFAAVIGIIGGADGPTAMISRQDRHKGLGAACSSLHFKPVEQVEWQMVFHEKLHNDAVISLIPEI